MNIILELRLTVPADIKVDKSPGPEVAKLITNLLKKEIPNWQPIAVLKGTVK